MYCLGGVKAEDTIVPNFLIRCMRETEKEVNIFVMLLHFQHNDKKLATYIASSYYRYVSLLLTYFSAIGLAVIDIYCLPGNVEQIQKLYHRVVQGTYIWAGL